MLVNNAGIARGGGIEETSEELWDQVLAVNTKGVFLGTRKALPAMRRAGGGSIINVSSIAGILGRRLAGSAYSASKGAVRTFTKSTAIQHASEGIRCNSIHPGPVDTPMLAGATDNPEILAVRTNEVPLGRLGTSQDVAYGALYLASDESAWITGIELVIDGWDYGAVAKFADLRGRPRFNRLRINRLNPEGEGFTVRLRVPSPVARSSAEPSREQERARELYCSVSVSP